MNLKLHNLTYTTFGYQTVVIYVEPTPTNAGDLLPNTSRTHLILKNETLPWENWASEFSAKLPPELKELVEEAGAKAADSDHSKSIRNRLKQIWDLLKISRYRKTTSGRHSVGLDTVPGGEPKVLDELTHCNGSKAGGRGGKAGDLYSMFLTSGGVPAKEISVDAQPKCKWISAEDETRVPPDLEDRAARYIAEQNLLLINADFRIFTDMVTRWKKEIADVPGTDEIVKQEVKQWFEQQLIEAVLGAQSLRQSTEWTSSDLTHLWNEVALTAVILPRYHVYNSIKRGLGAKFGKFKDNVA